MFVQIQIQIQIIIIIIMRALKKTQKYETKNISQSIKN